MAAVSRLQDDTYQPFPVTDPGIRPLGSRVLVQIRTPRSITKGGIHVPEEARDTDKDVTQVAKVISVGPVAFHNRDTMEPWPEGAWCKAGDFVRVPKYQGDRYNVPIHGRPRGESAMFVIFDDLNIIALVTGDPDDVRSYV